MIPVRNFRVRRATLEDLPALSQLWTTMGFAVDTLAKRITEFQIAEDESGQLVGAVALQMAQRQGLIHSEGFGDFSLADAARPLLWARIQTLASNHGLHRLWTQENSPFWHQLGLTKAGREELGTKPAAWNATGDWLTLKLREDIEELLSNDSSFALFVEQQKAQGKKLADQARVARTIATLLGVILFLAVLVGAFLVLFRRRGM
jgi:N-acetylglutamate synthase-like GNAT family acetyltransferase